MACSRVKFTFTLYLHSNTSRHFRNKKKAYLKAKIDELESKNKIKKSETYRDINAFKGYKPRTNIE